MQIIFRKAEKKDSEEISEIFLTSRKKFLSYAPLAHTDEEVRLWIRQTLVPSGGVTVAVAKGTIAGFLAVSHHGSHGWVDHLYLAPSATGSGLGTALLELAKTQLPHPIRLWTFQENEGSRRFYRRHGFREIEFTDGSNNEEKTADVLMEWP